MNEGTELFKDVKAVPAVQRLEGHGARGYAMRPCPKCAELMRSESLCCGVCWRGLSAALRVALWTAETVQDYTAAGAGALKALGVDAMDLRIPPRLPSEELATGWEGRYPEAERILGRAQLSVMQGKIKLGAAARASMLAWLRANAVRFAELETDKEEEAPCS